MQKKKSHAGGEACGEEEKAAVIQPYKRRRATPEARPAEKGNLRGDKWGSEKEKTDKDEVAED
jgi:hypothetical protein